MLNSCLVLILSLIIACSYSERAIALDKRSSSTKHELEIFEYLHFRFLLKKFSSEKQLDDSPIVRRYVGANVTMFDDDNNFGHIYFDGRDAEVLYDLLEVDPSASTSLGSQGSVIKKTGQGYECYNHYVPESAGQPAYSCSLFMNYYAGELHLLTPGQRGRASGKPDSNYQGGLVSTKVRTSDKATLSRVSVRGIDAKALYKAIDKPETQTSWDVNTVEKIGPHYRCYKTKQADLFYFRCVFDFVASDGALSPLP